MVGTGLVSTKGWRTMRMAATWVLGAWLLAACTSTSRAPVVDISEQPQAPAAQTSGGMAGAQYTVRPGDTLYSISKAHNISWRDLANWNSITDPSQLRVGQSLRVGPAGSVAQPSAPADTGAVAQVEPIKDVGVEQRPLEGSVITPPDAGQSTSAPTTPAPTNNSGIDWLWPASGSVVSTFNKDLNKGVDIAGNVGDPVVASADGVVVYSGSGLRGYGKLLIVRHNSTYLSAYAHNSVLLAKEGQNVRRGEKIAELGQTDAPSPRLHFEIRRGGTPEDPMKYLPAR